MNRTLADITYNWLSTKLRTIEINQCIILAVNPLSRNQLAVPKSGSDSRDRIDPRGTKRIPEGYVTLAMLTGSVFIFWTRLMIYYTFTACGYPAYAVVDQVLGSLFMFQSATDPILQTVPLADAKRAMKRLLTC